MATHVVAVTPPPVHADTLFRYECAHYGATATNYVEKFSSVRAGAYGAAMKAEADALGVACLDLHSAMLGVDGGEETWSVYLGAKDLKVVNAP